MKILVIFTGGTIGSDLNNGWISPDNKVSHTLLDRYRTAFPDIQFDTCEPYTILSEHLAAEHIMLLTKTVCDNLDKDYDGIIVAHGTDTLAYSAAALYFAVGIDSIPVLLVSANKPLSNPDSNGKMNFLGAIKFIMQKAGKGVFVSYTNPNEPTTFHHSHDVLLQSESDERIYSYRNIPYAQLDNGKVKILFDDHSFFSSGIGPLSLKKYPELLVVDAIPGQSYNHSLDNVLCVILRPYHSSTLDTKNEKFIQFCKRVKEKEIPLFMVNDSHSGTYESKKALDELGISTMPGPFAFVYMKLWIMLGKNEEE